MKYLDKVKLIVDRKEYNSEGVYKDTVGTIIEAEIRDNCFLVAFPDKEEWADIVITVEIKDLEFISSR